MVVELKFVSEKEDYFKKYILEKIKKNKGKTCYITFNKSCNSLRDTLIDFSDIKNLYTIDGVTKLLKEPSDDNKCKFILPYDIDKLEKDTLDDIEKGCNLVIFDSLSNLITYGQMVPAGSGLIVRFIKQINSKLLKRGGEIILLCKSKDKDNLLIEETKRYIESLKDG